IRDVARWFIRERGAAYNHLRPFLPDQESYEQPGNAAPLDRAASDQHPALHLVQGEGFATSVGLTLQRTLVAVPMLDLPLPQTILKGMNTLNQIGQAGTGGVNKLISGTPFLRKPFEQATGALHGVVGQGAILAFRQEYRARTVPLLETYL